MMDDDSKGELIKQTVQRIIQLEPNVSYYINKIDLGASSVYDDYQVAFNSGVILNSILDQMAADVSTLLQLLSNE